MTSNAIGKIRFVEYTLYLALFAFFASKVVTSLLKYQQGLLGVSNMEIHERHKKFPSISVCVDVKRDNMTVSGFQQVRPLNETFISLEYEQHFENGCVSCVVCSVARWQNLIPSFPWIAPGWRAWGRNQILQRSVAEP